MVASLHANFPEHLQHHLAALGVKCDVSEFEEPSKLKKIFIQPLEQAEKKIDMAFKGDQESIDWVVKLLKLKPDEVQAVRDESPEARAGLERRVNQRVRDIETSVEVAGRNALLVAIRNIYLGAVCFMALTLLCTIFLPNLPIQKKTRLREGEGLIESGLMKMTGKSSSRHYGHCII